MDGYGYGTHQRLLTRYLMRTTGPILELGCGNYSTPIIHEIAEAQARRVDTFDNNADWISKFVQLTSSLHGFHCVESWDEFCPQHHYGLALIDHAPAARRILEIRRLLDWVGIFVIHDTEDQHYGYHRVFPLLDVLETDVSMTPWTLVASPKATTE